jgi:lipoprotein-anchoring transpeptidase ErfK/SrfK
VFTRRPAAFVLGLLLATAGMAGCRAAPRPELSSERPLPPETTTVAPAAAVFAVATARGPSVAVFELPAEAEPSRSLDNPQPDGSALVLLVEEQRPGWLQVLLPVRPNGLSGWIREGDVTVATHDYRIEVELGSHTLRAWKGNELLLEDTVGVGARATPTVPGRFYTTGLFETGRTQPVYGPYAYPLSGYSEVLFQVGGGDGQMGIHGTDDPSSLGRNTSSGCIRMSNDAITRLAGILPVGVPVEIRA